MSSPLRDHPHVKPAIDFLSRIAIKLCGHEWSQITLQKFMSGNRFLIVDDQVVDVCFIDECCIDLSDYLRFKACASARIKPDGLIELDNLVVDLELSVR